LLEILPNFIFFHFNFKEKSKRNAGKKEKSKKKILILHIFRKLKGFKIVLAFFHLQG